MRIKATFQEPVESDRANYVCGNPAIFNKTKKR